MIKQYNGAKAQRRSGGREILPAGGYVAKILDAKVEHQTYRDGTSADKLIVSFDIAEGNFIGFFKKDYNENTNEDKKWRGVYRLTIPKDDGSERDSWSKNTFNNFIYALEDSNPGYSWDWNEAMLKGKMIGVLFREEEWEYNGSTGMTTRCYAVDAVSAIHEGKYKIAKPKLLKKDNAYPAPTPESVEDDGELPF